LSFTTAQLANATRGELVGDPTVWCNGAEIDTRRCVKGKVFFALEGTKVDGHMFLQDAIAGGCSAVVASHHESLSAPIIVVKNTRDALFQLAIARRNDIKLAHVIAITGSAGKTTTKDVLAAILGERTTSSAQSFNNDLGVPLTILDAEDSDFLVVEVGANAVGEIEPLARLVQPDIAILTSIDKAHLEGFGDRDTVLREKTKLFDALPDDGIAIVPDTVDLSSISISASVCRVGTSQDADVRISIDVHKDGCAILEMEGHRVTLALLGAHNGMNVALAVVAAVHANIRIGRSTSTKDLLDIASVVTGPKGRLHRVQVGDVTFLDDTYNANPASMRAAMRLFSVLDGERKVVVLGDMLELGSHEHAEHRHLASDILNAGADLIVLVGSAMAAAAHIPASVYEPEATDEAIERIVALIRPHDTVLIKGSRGLRLERIIETKQQMKVSRH